MESSLEAANFTLPEEVELFKFQIAGHKHAQCGILKHKDGSILKPLPKHDLRAHKELKFYETFFGLSSSPLHRELQKFLPHYTGCLNLRIGEKDVKFLILEDLCGKFDLPSILDIKIGPRTWDSTAAIDKIEYEKSKSPYGEQIGFRVIGMKVFDTETKLYSVKDKSFGKVVTPETVCSSLKLYLSSFCLQNCAMLCGFIHTLFNISQWFHKQREFIFYASSLLFVYESKQEYWEKWLEIKNLNESCFKDSIKNQTGEECNLCETCQLSKVVCTRVQNECPYYRVCMIDFGHVEESVHEDTNYLFGLHRLIEHFKDLLQSEIEKL